MKSAQTVSVVVGASQGIGEAIAIALAARGDRLVLASRDEDGLRSVAKKVATEGGTSDVVTVDLSDPSDIERFVGDVVRSFGLPRVLVNASGNSISKPALDVTVADWDRVHDLHLRGTFFLNVEVARVMIESGYGKIVNLCSTWSEAVTPGRSVYAAAKAGIRHLTAALAVEWAQRGVRVNAVAPGITLTPRTEERFASDPDRLEFHLQRIPMGRIGTPGDVVGAVEFLTSEASDFITGQTLFVDGGFGITR